MHKEWRDQQMRDMDEASDRWREEKRQLNIEIDKLEAALANAKDDAAGKRGPVKQKGVDPLAFAKFQQAAEQKLNQANEAWQAERSKLLSEINRLEGAVADAIARASNPLRMTQTVKEQFEIELTRVVKEKTEVEQSFLRAKTQWEQEKLKMTGEMVKLRRAAQIMGRPVPKEDTPEINPKVRDLENQLKNNLAQWSAERERLVAQVHHLEESARHWEAERRQLNDHAGQLQQAFMEAESKVHSYEASARTADTAHHQLEKLHRENEAIERQSRDERNAWDTERRRLDLELNRLQQQLQRRDKDHVSKEIVEQLRQQYEQKLHDAIRQKTELAKQFESASTLLESERSRLNSVQRTSGGAGLDNETISAEVAKVEVQLSEIGKIVDNPNTELSTVIRKNVEKAELDAYLRGILFCLGKR
jgi:uncharacterized protein YeeX (DUF496 family)